MGGDEDVVVLPADSLAAQPVSALIANEPGDSTVARVDAQPPHAEQADRAQSGIDEEPSIWERYGQHTTTPHASADASTEPFTHTAPTARSVFWNSVVQIIAKVIGFGSGIIVLSLTTRILTPTHYGDYIIATTYLSFFGVIADVGVNGIAMREVSRYPRFLHEILSASFALKVALSLLAYGGGALIVFFLPYSTDVKLATVILAVSMFIASVGYTTDVVFQARLQMQYPSLGDLIFRVVMLVGTVGLFAYAVTQHATQTPLFYGTIVTLAVGYVASIMVRWVAVRRLFHFQLRINLRLWKHLAFMAAPLGLAIILGQIHYKADTILLSLIDHNTRDVAIYGLAYKLLDIMQLFFPIFTGMLFPILGRFTDHSAREFRTSAQRVLNTSVVLVAPCAAGAILVAPELLDIIGKGQYPESVPTLQILSISLVFSFLSLIYNNIIILQNRQRALIWTTGIAMTINVAVNLYAIPRYSYTGAAVATAISEALFVCLSAFVANRRGLILPSPKLILQVAVACGLMVFVVILVRLPVASLTTIVRLAVLAGVGACVYGVVLLAVGGVDRALLTDILQRRRASKTQAS